MPNRTALAITSPLIWTLVASCGGGGQDLGKNIGETASKNFVEAAKQFDAIGLKKLLDENEDLRRKLAEAQVLYQVSSGQGAVNVGNQILAFRVLDYSGDVRVTAMINGPSGRFINNERLTSVNVVMPFDAKAFFDTRFSDGGKWAYPSPLPPNCLAIPGESLDVVSGATLLNAYVQATFLKYLANTNAKPQTSLPEYKLNERFTESGMNRLIVEVTPTGLTADNKWHFRGALVLRNSAGAESTLATFRADQQSHTEGLNKAAKFEEPLRVLLSNTALPANSAASR